MVDLMLDIESLGNIPGCVLCQYTLVPFNINGQTYDGPLMPLNVTLHIGQQIAEGYDVDQDTLAWWMKNDVAVRRRVFSGALSVESFCETLSEYLVDVNIEHTSYRIWSTSAKVDFGIPPVLFKRSNIPYPVFHRAERCARTFIELTKLKFPQMKLPKGSVTHDAIEDCWKQIQDLQHVYKTFMQVDELQEEANRLALINAVKDLS